MKKIKLHQILLGLIIVLFVSAVILKLIKDKSEAQKVFQSQKTQIDITQELASSESLTMYSELDSLLKQEGKDIGPLYISVFKDENTVELWLPQIKKVFKFKLSYKSIGKGLRAKTTDSAFPDGIYKIKNVGWHSETGYFIQLDYPSAQALRDPKIEIQNFKHDAVLITKTPIFYSFILLEDTELEILVYALLRWGYKDAKVASFPSRPPLSLSVDGTMLLVEIYTELTKLYNEVTGELYGPK